MKGFLIPWFLLESELLTVDHLHIFFPNWNSPKGKRSVGMSRKRIITAIRGGRNAQVQYLVSTYFALG